MKRKDIIKLARESGFEFKDRAEPRLERFAAFVAAAKEAEFNDGLTIAYMHGYEKGKDAGAAAEREACARVADRHSTCKNDTPDVIAVAIRARGQS